MNIIIENTGVMSLPQKIKKYKNNNLRFEAVIQTAGDVNRNRRRYKRGILEQGVDSIRPRLLEGSYLGELDHPIDSNPVRQTTVLYKEASHRYLDMGWDGNKLVAVVECLRTPNGKILSNLAEDGLPIGFSFRGMGDVRPVNEGGYQFMDVQGPIHCVTWDAVSYPSHAQATLIKITESVVRQIHESVGMGCRSLTESMSSIVHDISEIKEHGDLICTESGICYLPTQFDQMVEQRVIKLVDKFKV